MTIFKGAYLGGAIVPLPPLWALMLVKMYKTAQYVTIFFVIKCPSSLSKILGTSLDVYIINYGKESTFFLTDMVTTYLSDLLSNDLYNILCITIHRISGKLLSVSFYEMPRLCCPIEFFSFFFRTNIFVY